MIGLKYIRPALNFLGIGWSIKFSGLTDKYPAIEYVCMFCKKPTAWIAGSTGFNGVAPRATCCAEATAYPVGMSEFAAHLTAKPIWDNTRAPKQGPFMDTWNEAVTGDYPCDAPAPRMDWK